MIALALLALTLQASDAHAHAPAARVARLVGHWEGAFSRMGSVQVASVDLRVVGDSLAGTFAIGDLGLAGEPLKHVVVTDSTIASYTYDSAGRHPTWPSDARMARIVRTLVTVDSFLVRRHPADRWVAPEQ